MSILMNNTVLQAAEQKVESQLTAQNRQNYLKIVVAGMHAAMDGGPNGILATLQGSKDPVHDCAVGAVGLVHILRKQAHGVMPVIAMVPATFTLMFKALDFADKSGIAKIGAPELDRATHICMDVMLKYFHITPQMLNNAATNVHAALQDPDQMARIKMQMGFTKHPGAPEPTPLPGGSNVPA